MNAQTNASRAAKSNADQQGESNAAPAGPSLEDRLNALPVVKLNDVEVRDLTGEATSPARKYEKVHTAAVGSRMPIQSGWKHGLAMFVPGSVTKEFRAGSVFGTIVDIVKRAGRAGIPSYELATQLRMAQIGNKRSHYCTALPPVGWAEGYINSAVTQGLINTHSSRKADPLVVQAAEKAGDDAGEGAKTGTNG